MNGTIALITISIAVLFLIIYGALCDTSLIAIGTGLIGAYLGSYITQRNIDTIRKLK